MFSEDEATQEVHQRPPGYPVPQGTRHVQRGVAIRQRHSEQPASTKPQTWSFFRVVASDKRYLKGGGRRWYVAVSGCEQVEIGLLDGRRAL